MALPKKGTRKIDVDGTAYRWVIRRKPSYSEAINQANLKAVVELYESPASVLTIDFMCARNDSWLSNNKTEIGPRHIQQAIEQAISLGWVPNVSGNNHEVQLNAI